MNKGNLESRIKKLEHQLNKINLLTQEKTDLNLMDIATKTQTSITWIHLLSTNNILIKAGIKEKPAYIWNRKIPVTYKLSETLYNQYIEKRRKYQKNYIMKKKEPQQKVNKNTYDKKLLFVLVILLSAFIIWQFGLKFISFFFLIF